MGLESTSLVRRQQTVQKQAEPEATAPAKKQEKVSRE